MAAAGAAAEAGLAAAGAWAAASAAASSWGPTTAMAAASARQSWAGRAGRSSLTAARHQWSRTTSTTPPRKCKHAMNAPQGWLHLSPLTLASHIDHQDLAPPAVGGLNKEHRALQACGQRRQAGMWAGAWAAQAGMWAAQAGSTRHQTSMHTVGEGSALAPPLPSPHRTPAWPGQPMDPQSHLALFPSPIPI